MKVISNAVLAFGYNLYPVGKEEMDIKNISAKGKKPYYALYDGKGRYVRYIGDAEDLTVFKRDIQIGKQAAEMLKEKPYLNPKAAKLCQSIQRMPFRSRSAFPFRALPWQVLWGV